jgi:quinolinate synthase
MSTETLSNQLSKIEEALQTAPDQLLEFQAKKETIEKIIRLKEEKNVLILGHNYMAPLVYQLSGERERGDSLALAQRAAKTDKPIILFDGVRFMAETAKILNPDKKVLIADIEAGCSLAEPFGPEEIESYRKQYPGVPVVTYINSYANIKAVSDYCCTSANGVKVVRHAAKEYGTNQVIFFPDSLMGANIEHELLEEGIEIIYPGKKDTLFGRCEVHEQFTAEMMRNIRQQHNIQKDDPTSAILVHWECSAEVLEEADFYGSTSQMAIYLKEHPELKRVYLGTECEMAANLEVEYPEIEFVKTCSFFCQHMRKITLDKILYSLENEVYELEVDEEIAEKSRKAIDRMLSIV